MTTLGLQEVCKSFGGVIAAQNVTLDVKLGRVTGIIGPNGAGKTTLVNLITGMLPLTSGAIYLDDRDLTHASPTEVGRCGIARTFQNIRLQAESSVVENVMIGCHRLEQSSLFADLLGLPSARRESAEMRQRAWDLLERFDMSAVAEVHAGTLSYGDQRRIEIMRALASQPAVLLLDEPVAGMNDVEADRLKHTFRDVAATDVAVLVIEHNMRFIADVSDELYVLDRGVIIASGEPQDVLSDAAVITAYLGEDHA